jgi:hypothetical protein
MPAVPKISVPTSAVLNPADSVSAPKDSEGEILQDRALIDWAWVFLAQVFKPQD